MSETTLTNSPAALTSKTNATDIVRAIVTPIASLKLTVALLVIAVFVTWIITLEQATYDIWALKNKHFHSMFVYVPLTTFFPLNWFPNRPEIPFGLFVPSGLTIITLMLVNLTAAHTLRFKIQASGTRLVLGLFVMLASAFLTWTIIFNYQDADGFGGKPPIPWANMWKYLQVAVLGLGIASVYTVVTLAKERLIERFVYGLLALSMFVLLGISLWLGEDAFIGDSAMRIMWQLAQSTVAALAVLAGCVLLFKRKGGIVLLHLGIAGLLLNEIYVTTTNEEHRVTFIEGQTVHHAVDLRETEFVLIDRSDPEFDQMTVVPGSLFESSDDMVDDPRFPFKFRCLEYMKHSNVVRVGPMAENKANAGFGKRFIAMAAKPASGADANAGADQASAYVELFDRENNESIGKYLLSQAAYDQEIIDTVTVGDKDYQIGLRFKTIYTPYSLELKDTQAKYYVGTKIPSWFSSDFVIDDEENGIKSEQKIWMNNPLRYRDQTFYQTSYLEDSNDFLEGNQELSSMQVVRNKGWMIPYVCCMFVVVGLVAQFQQVLISFLTKKKSSAKDEPENDDTTPRRTSLSWVPTVILLGIFGFYYGSQFAKSMSPELTKSKGSDIRLDLLGQIPVTFEGRVQPLDSYARNLARQMSNRELITDEFGKKQPAMRWFADMMFDDPAGEQYEILRVEDVNVQNALGFPKRKGLKYKFSELREANNKLFELLVGTENKAPEELTLLEERLKEVYGKSRYLIGTQTAFFGSDDRYSPGDNLGRLEVANNLAATTGVMPYAIPTNDPETPWLPLSIAIEQMWLADLAAERDAESPTVLATKLLDEEVAAMKPDLVKKKIIADLLEYEDIVEGLSSKFGLENAKELADVLERNWHQVPERLYEKQLVSATRFVESRLNEWRYAPDLQNDMSRQDLMASMIDRIGFNGGKLTFDRSIVENLMGLKQAYQNGDATQFNEKLEKHMASIVSASPTEFSQTRHTAEISYNYFSPFYVATCLYLFAFVVTIFSWLGWQAPINRAAFWLVALALFVHLGGVVARVVISGRPPITNLYSSFVVVAAGTVFLLMIVEYTTRLGLGNLLAAASGFMSLTYAWTLSIDQGDTFTVLRAVLDTQFWLTTHVIIINLGYSATLVAGLVGLALLFCMMVSGDFDKSLRRDFTNIIYGSVCFALLFSFFGTVLGGLWADDSWGRFWGWDPKENGALMIVLWNAVILHARWAGMVKERGIAALAALGNIIVMWSWEGVNQLGVGLHAYADSSGGAATGSIFMEPMFYIQLFCMFNLIVACLAAVVPLSWYRSYQQEDKLSVS